VKVCPHCGKPTEVYSRITGYYRPVQNWNDGKLQEYANRTEYDVANSVLKRPAGAEAVAAYAPVAENVAESTDEVKYLFTTKTCPNCKLAKEYLQGVEYEIINAEENMELAQRFGVMQAPTLVVVSGDEYKKYVNASNIKKYADSMVMA
ncbi:MAG: ribonucleoside triphosphate reductase, partial [Lachnospiraceae bacterium]|nr:ribonucleoside triphosphate reductase [Lachnospiraceae bacterium]